MEKIKMVVTAIVALSLATSGIAFGQGKSDRDGRGRGGQYGNDHRDRNDNRGRNERAPGKSGYPGRGHDDDRRKGRGAGPAHSVHRGDRLPVQYHNRYYVVDDWRGHRLSAPPRGAHWVQTGGDYVLTVVATGIILELFLAR